MISPRRLFSFSIGLGATNHVLTEPRHYVLFTVWPADINNAADKGLFSIQPQGPNINELWITVIFSKHNPELEPNYNSQVEGQHVMILVLIMKL